MASNNGQTPEKTVSTATVYLKEPLTLPDGSEISEALFGGYKVVQTGIPIQVPTQVMKGQHLVTEMKQGMAMIQMPVGLIALLIPVGDGEVVEVSVPMSDVRLLVNTADYAKLENRADASHSTA